MDWDGCDYSKVIEFIWKYRNVIIVTDNQYNNNGIPPPPPPANSSGKGIINGGKHGVYHHGPSPSNATSLEGSNLY